MPPSNVSRETDTTDVDVFRECGQVEFAGVISLILVIATGGKTRRIWEDSLDGSNKQERSLWELGTKSLPELLSFQVARQEDAAVAKPQADGTVMDVERLDPGLAPLWTDAQLCQTPAALAFGKQLHVNRCHRLGCVPHRRVFRGLHGSGELFLV